MSPRFLLPLLAAVLLIAAPSAQAQLTDKQASKNLKSALKAESKAFAKDTKQLGKAVSAEIASITAEAGSDGFNTLDLMLLDQLLMDLRDDLALKTGLASVDVAGVMSETFLALAMGAEGAPAPLDGLYPDGFYFGERGPIDQAFDSFDKSIDKLVVTLEKRLSKFAKVLEKKQGIGFTFELPLPYRRLWFTVVDNGSAPSQANEFDVGFAYAYSDLAVSDDGVLCLGGSARNNMDAIEVELRGGADNISDEILVASPSEDTTWFVCFSDLPEGNYLVEVRVEGNPVTQYLTIGVR